MTLLTVSCVRQFYDYVLMYPICMSNKLLAKKHLKYMTTETAIDFLSILYHLYDKYSVFCILKECIDIIIKYIIIMI